MEGDDLKLAASTVNQASPGEYQIVWERQEEAQTASQDATGGVRHHRNMGRPRPRRLRGPFLRAAPQLTKSTPPKGTGTPQDQGPTGRV
jgi:hypothetical protein